MDPPLSGYGAGSGDDWVSERKPKTIAEAGRLADDYAQARGHKERERGPEAGWDNHRTPEEINKRCHTCGKIGHLARNCRQGTLNSTEKTQFVAKESRQRGGDAPRCYNCQERGHLANQCPSKPVMFCSYTEVVDKGEPALLCDTRSQRTKA